MKPGMLVIDNTWPGCGKMYGIIINVDNDCISVYYIYDEDKIPSTNRTNIFFKNYHDYKVKSFLNKHCKVYDQGKLVEK